MNYRGGRVTILIIFVFWFGMAGLLAEELSPLGLWQNEDATFQIFESGGKLGAKIVALKVPKTPEGKEKTDIHNRIPRSEARRSLVWFSCLDSSRRARLVGREVRSMIPRAVTPIPASCSWKVRKKSRCADLSVFRWSGERTIGAV